MKYGILGEDGSTNGCAYDSVEDAQRQIDELKKGYPKTWPRPLHVVEYWVLECVNFCRYHYPSHVNKWKNYEFEGIE